MPRPQKCRQICSKPKYCRFEPAGKCTDNCVKIGYDEYETIRLIDHEGCSQEECAVKMNVSRPTVSRMYETSRRKIADALVNGKNIVISGGDVNICSKMKPECQNNPSCCHRRKE